ncbi:MAG: FAD/NAD(P)-binding protein [PVC group bacterium]
MKNPYQPIPAEIEEVITESPTIKTFVFRPAEEFTFRAGQFVGITVPGLGEAPFTPSSSPFEKEKLEVTIMRVGAVTDRLHEMGPGAVVGLRGPFGKEYPLETYRGKEILLVGGGVGLAPLRALFLALAHDVDAYQKIIFCCGARSPEDLIYKKKVISEWPSLHKNISIRVTVDKVPEGQQWEGNVGLVTTALDNLDVTVKESVAVVCGPPIMMKFVTFKLAAEVGYPPGAIYLSMEKNMSCGIGKCGHCRLGPYFVCQDGPVLTFDKLKDLEGVWD